MTQHIPATVPAELAAHRAWLVWKFVPNGEKKPRKVPYYCAGPLAGQPRGGTPEAPRPQGSPEDRGSMGTFDEAERFARERGFIGLGFAVLPDQNLVGLDFDDCVEQGATGPVIDPRVAKLVAGTYSEFSPSGKGLRAFMRGSLASRKDLPPNLTGDYPVEYFGHNGFVTITGNATPECELFGFDTFCDLTPAVLDDYRARFGAVQSASSTLFDDDSFGLMALTPTLGLDLAQIAEHLTHLPTDLDYDSWVKVGMAVHHETGGTGFDLWHNWSKSSPKYTTEQYCAERWRSFGRFGGQSITMAWVVKQANEGRARESYKLRDEWKAKLQACTDDFTLREKLCKELARDSRVGELDREDLAQVLLKVFAGLGNKYPIATCRKLVAPVRSERPAMQQGDLPDWARGWCYVTDDDKFFRLDSDEWLSMQGFNAKFNRMQPRDEDGSIVKSAAWVALEDLALESVTRGVYLPWAGPTFDLNGVHCANTYRPSSVPKAVDGLSDAGRAAVQLVIKHLSLLCGGRGDVVETIIAWMAHNAQKPGVKIRWTPLVKGVEGDGKTLLGQVMGAVLGQPNVKMISPKVLGTDFSDWAHGACVGVLEEIKLTGHNRFDILNALKPFITNDQVAVHPKGSAEFNVVNTMNYMAFTNHADALPLGETDRRWFIVFTPFSTKEGLYAALGGEGAAGGYFDRLHAAIETQRAELRRWLLDYLIPASFKPNGSAPDTAEKALMVGMSTSPEEEAVREVLADGAEGVTKVLLSSNCLSDALMLRDNEVSLQTTQVSKVLTRMGYAKVPAKLKWRGRSHRVWTKDIANTEPAYLREKLDLTVVSASGGAKGAEFEADYFDSEPHSEPSLFS